LGRVYGDAVQDLM
jgi:hypothetical protein